MSAQFENSRCAELIEAAAARAGGKQYSLRDAPAEVKAILVMTVRMGLVQLCPQLVITSQGRAMMEEFSRMIAVLDPSLFEKDGEKPAVINRVAKLFFADLEDLRDGKLDNPPL